MEKCNCEASIEVSLKEPSGCRYLSPFFSFPFLSFLVEEIFHRSGALSSLNRPFAAPLSGIWPRGKKESPGNAISYPP